MTKGVPVTYNDSFSNESSQQMNQEIYPTQTKGWFGRNWKWLIPTGCLGMLLLAVGFFVAIFYMVMGLMTSSDVYQFAVAKAQENPAVQQAIGTPIEPGILISGEIKLENASGIANLSIPIAGPKGKATIYVVAEKSAGQWSYSTLVVEISETGERIDMLEDFSGQ